MFLFFYHIERLSLWSYLFLLSKCSKILLIVLLVSGWPFELLFNFNCKIVYICFYFFTSFRLISCAVIYILTVKLSKYSLIFEHFQAGSLCSYFFCTLKKFRICSYCFISFGIVICAFNQFLAAKYSKYVLIFSPFSTSFLLFFCSNFKTISAQFLVQLFVLFPQNVLNLP